MTPRHDFIDFLLTEHLLACFPFAGKIIQAKIDFLKWYLSVNSSEIYGKFKVFGPKKIKKIDFSL
jgi:hypothetical protein